MKRWDDPFPGTPEGFHLRVEATLRQLEEHDMDKKRVFNKTVVLAAVIAALIAVTAVAAVVGNTRLKDALTANGAVEVAGLVAEAHLTGGAEGFRFSVDEIIWEDDDLYMTCSVAVPEGGKYLVGLYTPTLNGEKLRYDAKGWTSPKFCDQETPALLLYGGAYPDHSTELLTFAVDPALRERRDNQLRFKAVLLETDEAFAGTEDFGGLLDPPAFISDVSIDALVADGRAAVVTESDIDAALDTSLLPQTVYNDVKEHDFYVEGVRIHIDGFRLTHTGVEFKYTVSGDRLDDYLDQTEHMGFCTPDGRSIGLMLGANGGGGRTALPDGSPAFSIDLSASALIPLNGLTQVLYAPVDYPEDDQGRQLPPVYHMDRALVLTPTWSDEAEAGPSPSAKEEGEPLC